MEQIFIEKAIELGIVKFDGMHFTNIEDCYEAVDKFRAELKKETFTAQTLLEIHDYPSEDDMVLLTITERGNNADKAILIFATTVTEAGFTLKHTLTI